MNKIAVIFPGMGYTKDRPLLYYAGKIAKSYGYELIFVTYKNVSWDKEVLKDPGKMAGIFKTCIESARETLADVDLIHSDRILFISKSIGTLIATAIAAQYPAKISQICFTPIEQFGDYVETGNALVFYGSSDPFADPDIIGRICSEKKLESFRKRQPSLFRCVPSTAHVAWRWKQKPRNHLRFKDRRLRKLS